jgi:hypothetical protein
VFVLTQELALYESYQQQIAACDTQIEDYLNQLPTQLAPEQLGEPAAPVNDRKINRVLTSSTICTALVAWTLPRLMAWGPDSANDSGRDWA